jgi:cyclophilin family peptidyl-prolyl cis-trans isomerase/protein-disulfide isomerase
MKHLSLLILPVLFLVSCAPASPVAAPTATPTEVEIVIPTPPEAEQPTCNTLMVRPTPGPGADSRFPPVGAEDHVRGAQEAVVTIIVYDDFQCSDCNYLPLSQKLLEAHPQEVRFVYRHYPYNQYFDKAELAARAAEAAAAQDKFWEMHDLLFERQAEWVERSPASFEAWVKARVAELGLDSVRFESDFSSAETVQKVQEDAEEGAALGIPILPFLLVNGQVYTGSTNFEALDQVVRLLALGARQFTECPPVVIDPSRQYLATLYTEKGEVALQLYADKAPLAVNSFVFLARAGWYDGITFHRVLPGFVAQTGDPSGTGQGNPGYFFQSELDPSLAFDRPGVLAMANSGPDTNGSQFFITLAAAPHLDGQYTIFGQVLRGMEVLEALTPRDPQPGESLPPGDTLLRVTVEEK